MHFNSRTACNTTRIDRHTQYPRQLCNELFFFTCSRHSCTLILFLMGCAKSGLIRAFGVCKQLMLIVTLQGSNCTRKADMHRQPHVRGTTQADSCLQPRTKSRTPTAIAMCEVAIAPFEAPIISDNCVCRTCSGTTALASNTTANPCSQQHMRDYRGRLC
jgi:hypothetical protein